MAGRKLDQLLGKKADIRRSLFEALFGATGLVSFNDVISFDAAVERLRGSDGLLTQGPDEFRSYLSQRLLPLMRENCVAQRSTWTNNNCESINHVLKQAVQWQPNQLPDLIDKIRSLVNGQFAEADRALIGRGDFVLRPEWAKHRLPADSWAKMSDKQKRKAADACFRLQSAPCTTSTDGTLTVPTTPGGGKKPHQRKRCRTERTVTVSKKLKVDTTD